MKDNIQKPTPAFVGASWLALFVGGLSYAVGLWNAEMPLNEKGYYFTVIMYGLFASVSLQKCVRDRLEGIKVTSLYFGLCWLSVALCLLLLSVGLWNATLAPSEKGFYAMAYLLSLFGGVAVQKNVRDLELYAEPAGSKPKSADPLA
jgi:uncharacterized membrane protein YiaA